MKRKIASVMAMSLLGLQALVGTASAAGSGSACVYSGGILQAVGSTQGGNDGTVILYVSGSTLHCEVETNDDWSGSFAAVSQIQAEAEGDITVDLDNWTSFKAQSYAGKDITLASGETVLFNGNNATTAVKVVVSDKGLSLNGSTGSLVSAGQVWMMGGHANDTLDASGLTGVSVYAEGNDGKDVLKGGSEDDDLRGNAGSDTIVGGDGDDTIDTGDGVLANGNVILPGDGADTVYNTAAVVSYADSSTGVEIDLTGATPVVTDGDLNEDTFDSAVGSWTGSSRADEFIGSGSDDVFSGGNGGDVARGYAGNDALFGGAGNDKLVGNAGADTLRGGTGDDKLYGRGGADTLRGDSGSDEAWGGTGGDLCGAEVTDHCEYLP